MRLEQLVDAARTQVCGRRDFPDGQACLMRGHNSPDAFAISVYEPRSRETEAGNKLLLTTNPLCKLLMGFHIPENIWLSHICPVNWTS
jgi:hypothetical protein